VTDVAARGVRDALARHDWQRGYDLAARSWSTEAADEAERLDLFAESAWWLGRLSECIDARHAAYRLYDQAGDHRRAGQCAVWLYEHHCLRAEPAIGNGWLRRARRALDGDVECTAYGALLLREAELAHGAADLDGAIWRAEHARALARELDCADLEAEALQTLGRLLIDAGQPREGLAHLDEAMLSAVEGRLGPYSTGKVYCSLISACEELGDLRRAAEWTDATARWAERHPFAIFPGICRVHRADVLDRRGALADAEREATRACAELAESHIPNAAAAFAEAGDIRRRLGDLSGAEAAFIRAEELSGNTCPGAALLRLAQGQVDAAMQIISSCLASQPPERPARARMLAAAIQVSIAAGDQPTAQASLHELKAIAATYDSALFHAWATTAQGRLQLATQNPDACSTLQEALRRWHDLGVPYEIATSRTLLAQALRDAGHEDGALASFGEAQLMFERIGAQLTPSEIADIKPRRPAGLTERELEVLLQLAVGQSNKEIATRLHLSPKTVSRHLSNIFTKINVTSRAAATAFAFEHELLPRRERPRLTSERSSF
jgi:DNA-binding CsgD family transcriptional regulator